MAYKEHSAIVFYVGTRELRGKVLRVYIGGSAYEVLAENGHTYDVEYKNTRAGRQSLRGKRY